MSIVASTLPVFQRTRTSFDETFGVSVGRVLSEIGEGDDDPVGGTPRVGIGLQEVGYTRSDLVIQIDDPFESGRPVQSVATVRIGSGVPPSRRGLHVSRSAMRSRTQLPSPTRA